MSTRNINVRLSGQVKTPNFIVADMLIAIADRMTGLINSLMGMISSRLS